MMNEVRRDLQDELGITFEGINQTVIRLDQFGWLVPNAGPRPNNTPGCSGPCHTEPRAATPA